MNHINAGIQRTAAVAVAMCAVCVLHGEIFAQWRSEGLEGRAVNVLNILGDTLYAATDDGVLKRYAGDVQNGQWQPLGPLGEEVGAMVVVNPDVLLVAREPSGPEDPGMVMLTTDGGTTWNSIRGDSMQYAAVFYQPPDTDAVIFATTQASIVRSTDTGSAWQSVWGSWGQIGYGVHFVRQDPNNDSILWSGGESAIFQPFALKSTDGGDSWQRYDLNAGGDNAVYSAVIRPGNSDEVLLGMEGRIMLTTDGGATWSTVYEPEGYPYIYAMAYSPDNPQTVYASGLRNTSDPQPLVLHTSTDGGRTWSTISNDEVTIEGRSGFDMVVRRMDGADVLYIGVNGGVYSYTAAATDVVERIGVVENAVITPNPATDAAVLSLVLSRPGHCTITLHRVDGGQVGTVVSTTLSAGAHRLALGAQGLASGVYYCSITTGEGTIVRRFLVTR